MQWFGLVVLVQASFFISGVFAAFGLTESGNVYTVDTDAGLVFKVDKTNGDIISMVYNGLEAQDQGGKHSQIASGIGAACSWVRTGNDNNYIKITCSASGITHYYVARYKDSSIHMATYTTAEPSVGELRYIARLARSTVPNGPTASNVNGGTAIEGSDVFLVNGQTRSKFYSSRQFIDDAIHGVTGSGIGIFMIVPGTGFEGSSGGPFFRDIDNQGGSVDSLASACCPVMLSKSAVTPDLLALVPPKRLSDTSWLDSVPSVANGSDDESAEPKSEAAASAPLIASNTGRRGS